MPVFKLPDNEIVFPHPSLADSSGLLAVSHDLDPRRLILAYQHGIFPWYKQGDAFFWYAPDPRCVLYTKDLRVSKSMRSIFNQKKFRYTLDTCFERVMQACASTKRRHESGTWITDEFMESYVYLHESGIAHSVEVWDGDALVGGLYGVAIGKVFSGESMFARQTNASKAGFITLVKALQHIDFQMVDCQTETGHLLSLGAANIPRDQFMEHLEYNRLQKTLIGKWHFAGEGIDLAVPRN